MLLMSNNVLLFFGLLATCIAKKCSSDLECPSIQKCLSGEYNQSIIFDDVNLYQVCARKNIILSPVCLGLSVCVVCMAMVVWMEGVVVAPLIKTVLLVTSVPKRDAYLLVSIATLTRSA